MYKRLVVVRLQAFFRVYAFCVMPLLHEGQSHPKLLAYIVFNQLTMVLITSGAMVSSIC